MRIYKVDGTFTENHNDTEFGWSLNEIIVDEAVPEFSERNRETKALSLLRKSLPKESINNSLSNSIDLLNEPEMEESFIIERHDPKIKMQPIQNILDCKMKVEGLIDKKYLASRIDLRLPDKDNLTKLINPCSIETKMLLSVISFAKYKLLNLVNTTDEIYRLVNFKSTNFRSLINQDSFASDTQSYTNTNKEDSMLSLMLELIVTDIDCDIQDLDGSQTVNECNNSLSCLETSDLGNSIQSNCSSKEASLDKTNYVEVKNRSDLLNSVGITDDFDKSIQSFCEETFDMHLQLDEIKNSFQEEEIRIDNLISEAKNIERNLKETLYLDDILHLLNGDLEKVKFKKWPFKIFYKNIKLHADSEINLIV